MREIKNQDRQTQRLPFAASSALLSPHLLASACLCLFPPPSPVCVFCDFPPPASAGRAVLFIYSPRRKRCGVRTTALFLPRTCPPGLKIPPPLAKLSGMCVPREIFSSGHCLSSGKGHPDNPPPKGLGAKDPRALAREEQFLKTNNCAIQNRAIGPANPVSSTPKAAILGNIPSLATRDPFKT